MGSLSDLSRMVKAAKSTKAVKPKPPVSPPKPEVVEDVVEEEEEVVEVAEPEEKKPAAVSDKEMEQQRIVAQSQAMVEDLRDQQRRRKESEVAQMPMSERLQESPVDVLEAETVETTNPRALRRKQMRDMLMSAREEAADSYSTWDFADNPRTAKALQEQRAERARQSRGGFVKQPDIPEDISRDPEDIARRIENVSSRIDYLKSVRNVLSEEAAQAKALRTADKLDAIFLEVDPDARKRFMEKGAEQTRKEAEERDRSLSLVKDEISALSEALKQLKSASEAHRQRAEKAQQ